MASSIVKYHRATTDIAVLKTEDGEFWIGGYGSFLTHQNGEPPYYFIKGYWETETEALNELGQMTGNDFNKSGYNTPINQRSTMMEKGMITDSKALEAENERLRKALAAMVSWFPSADTYRRLGFDPKTPMQVLKEAKAVLFKDNRND